MWVGEDAERQSAVTCPFCGLACDDLSVERETDAPRLRANGCLVAERGFAAALATRSITPRIQGREVSLEEALDHGATLLRGAQAPLFGGLVTDVNGMRSALALADRCGATLDHANGDALFCNLLVLQDGGWITTTFAEVRNRADLVLIFGSQCLARFPRLLERVLTPPEALFSPPAQRRLVLLGPWEASALPAPVRALGPTLIPVKLGALAGVAGILRALIGDRPVSNRAPWGITDGALEALAEALKGARYSVLTWSAAELDFPHAELTVQALVELARDLNRTTRSAALPLAGSLGDLTASQVCAWQAGFPLRISLAEGKPRYEPFLYRHQGLISRGESDLLLWISALAGQAPAPATEAPLILLGQGPQAQEAVPEVQIPVGVPGVDHPGHWYRGDSVCALPLGRLRTSALPSVAEVLNRLDARLTVGY
jgi:formylmethanofuran dehydrogenase subunit B